MEINNGLGPPESEPELSPEEIAQLRNILRENAEKARAEARKQGVKLHPKIAARRKAR